MCHLVCIIKGSFWVYIGKTVIAEVISETTKQNGEVMIVYQRVDNIGSVYQCWSVRDKGGVVHTIEVDSYRSLGRQMAWPYNHLYLLNRQTQIIFHLSKLLQ